MGRPIDHGECSGGISRLYYIWNAMKQRCHNSNNRQFCSYGARGISVCADWQKFSGFKRWAMASGYSRELTIDRIDNSSGYSPENCRWANIFQQANNRRSNRKFTLNGICLGINELARMAGLSRGAMTHRLLVLQWPAEKAVGLPKIQNGKKDRRSISEGLWTP